MEKPGARLLLVDGHAYAYRSYHAIRDLTSPTGEPTNAIFGFIKAVTSLIERLSPSHGVVVWDGGLAAERLALLPDYKAQRPPMPPGLAVQLDGMIEWLEAAGIASLVMEGVEADDAIGTLAAQAPGRDVQVVIASSDKDFLQLVSGCVTIVNPNDKSGRLWSTEDVVAKTGVRPDQVVDWLCLIGDTVDNIPGIQGVGTKTAAALLNEFGTCRELIERVAEVKSERVREALLTGKERLIRNRQMIALKTDLSLPMSADDLGLQTPDPRRLAMLYERWGFRSMLADLGGTGERQATLGI